jgi:hypothetical protein
MVRIATALSFSVAVIAGAVWFANRPASAGGPLNGDANCDGSVNSIDAAVVLQYSAGLLPSLGCPANADVNGSGSANSLDSAIILQFAAGLLTHLGPPVGPTPTPTPGPLCPDGYYWNPSKGHCDSHECPPGLVFDPVLLYCVLPLTPAPTATNTPSPGSTPVQHEPIYYHPTFYWSNTDIALHAGQRVDVQATGSVIYDNYHLGGVTPDGDGSPTGWGNCQDHSLVGWVGAARPAADAPVSLANVICLGSDFSGPVPTSGDPYISINDRGGFINNVGSWNVTVTVY